MSLPKMTELRRRILLNDLTNNLKAALKEYKEFHRPLRISDMVKIAHEHGFRLHIKLEPIKGKK